MELVADLVAFFAVVLLDCGCFVWLPSDVSETCFVDWVSLVGEPMKKVDSESC